MPLHKWGPSHAPHPHTLQCRRASAPLPPCAGQPLSYRRIQGHKPQRFCPSADRQPPTPNPGSESRSAQPQPPFLHYYPPASLPHPCQTASQSGLVPHPVPFAYLQILHLPFVPLPPFYFHLSKPYRILFIFTNICSLFFHFIRFCSPCQRLFSLLHRLFRQSHCRKNHRTPQISPEVHPFAV